MDGQVCVNIGDGIVERRSWMVHGEGLRNETGVSLLPVQTTAQPED
jgi:hypothetical protein